MLELDHGLLRLAELQEREPQIVVRIGRVRIVAHHPLELGDCFLRTPGVDQRNADAMAHAGGFVIVGIELEDLAIFLDCFLGPASQGQGRGQFTMNLRQVLGRQAFGLAQVLNRLGIAARVDQFGPQIRVHDVIVGLVGRPASCHKTTGSA